MMDENIKYQIKDSEELLEFKRRVEDLKNNPEKLKMFLINAGIIDTEGNLTGSYVNREP